MLETIFTYRGATQFDGLLRPLMFRVPQKSIRSALPAVSQLYAALCNFLQGYYSFSQAKFELTVYNSLFRILCQDFYSFSLLFFIRADAFFIQAAAFFHSACFFYSG